MCRKWFVSKFLGKFTWLSIIVKISKSFIYWIINVCCIRFCQECIITALRSGNKECPTCRKKLVSKRSLRPDPNFDALISKIYPSRDEYEAHQERVLAKLKQVSGRGTPGVNGGGTRSVCSLSSNRWVGEAYLKWIGEAYLVRVLAKLKQVSGEAHLEWMGEAHRVGVLAKLK